MNISKTSCNTIVKPSLPGQKNTKSANTSFCAKNTESPLIKAHHALSFGYGRISYPKEKQTENPNFKIKAEAPDYQALIDSIQLLLNVSSRKELTESLEYLSQCDNVLVFEALSEYINGDKHNLDTKTRGIIAAGYVSEIFDPEQKASLIKDIKPYLDSPNSDFAGRCISALALLGEKGDRDMVDKFKEILGETNDIALMQDAMTGIVQLGEVTDADFLLPFIYSEPASESASVSLIAQAAYNSYCELVPLKGFRLEERPLDNYLTGKIEHIFFWFNDKTSEAEIKTLGSRYGEKMVIDHLIPIMATSDESEQVKALRAVGILADKLSPVDKLKMKLYVHRIIMTPELRPKGFSEALITIAKLSEPNDEVSIRFFCRLLNAGMNIITKSAAEAIGIVGNQAHAELLEPYTRGKSANAQYIREIYDALKKKPASGDRK